MTNQVISDIGQLTNEWLTSALRRSGALRVGVVRDFAAQLQDSTNARFATIRLSYSTDAIGSRPTQLLLKMCAGSDESFGPSEVDYYTRDYGQFAPHKWIWWPKLCRGIAAFYDLGCAALWKET